MAWELTAGPDLEISLISYSLSSCLPAFCGVHPPVCGGLHAEAFKDQRGRACSLISPFKQMFTLSKHIKCISFIPIL